MNGRKSNHSRKSLPLPNKKVLRSSEHQQKADDTVASLNAQAERAKSQRKYEEAEVLYWHVLELQERQLGHNHLDQPLFAWLQGRHGFRVTRAQEDLIARLATQHERQLLQISPNAPVVAIDRTVFAHTGRVVEWAHILAVAALYTFTYEYDILDWNQEQRNGNIFGTDQATHTPGTQ